mmetsp:Transcript_127536/g.285318  ORF Transcript_127536/g.285318 Transcript_127536/m.285318 type:complete len:444 (+) Transcript_127536:85-1416(+)
MAPTGPGTIAAAVVAICLAALSGSSQGGSAGQGSGSASLALHAEPQALLAFQEGTCLAELVDAAKEVPGGDDAKVKSAALPVEQGEFVQKELVAERAVVLEIPAAPLQEEVLMPEKFALSQETHIPVRTEPTIVKQQFTQKDNNFENMATALETQVFALVGHGGTILDFSSGACWPSAGLFGLGGAVDLALALGVAGFLGRRQRRTECGGGFCKGESACTAAALMPSQPDLGSPQRSLIRETSAEKDPAARHSGMWQATPAQCGALPWSAPPSSPPSCTEAMQPSNVLLARQLTKAPLERQPQLPEVASNEAMPQDVELSGHAVSQEEEVVELNGKLTEDFLKRLELETCAKHIHHAEAALHRWGRATSSRASAIGSWPPRESPGPCSPPLTPKEELPEMPTPGDRSQRQLLEEIWLVDLLSEAPVPRLPAYSPRDKSSRSAE